VIGPIPAVGSVVAVLEAAGLHANNPAETSFTVNEIERGEIVVSCTSWSGLKIADAAKAIEDDPAPSISVVTYMELVQGVRDKKELKTITSFLADMGIPVLPLTENIGHRASIYLEEHALKHGRPVMAHLNHPNFRWALTAEDLAQEVCLRVYRARAGYKPTAKFSTWIHTIANNVASDLRQRAYRRREHGMPMNVSASSSAIGLEQIAVAASGQRPARQADRGELQDVVQEAIRGLSDNQRMAVLLAKFEQCSYDEIAAAMGLTVPAVKSLLFRAREQLREMLGPYEREGHR
jgi:RNA polymerase sigma-70 factor (ECF subfamily)